MVEANWPGLRHANMIKTGERTYCIIAEWSDMAALANVRPQMIATLDWHSEPAPVEGGPSRAAPRTEHPPELVLRPSIEPGVGDRDVIRLQNEPQLAARRTIGVEAERHAEATDVGVRLHHC
jgi:hypothetical protein